MSARLRMFAAALLAVATLLVALAAPARWLTTVARAEPNTPSSINFPSLHKSFTGTDGLQWNDVLSIQSGSTVPASVTVTFYAENGQPIVPNPLVTPAGPVANPLQLAQGAV